MERLSLSVFIVFLMSFTLFACGDDFDEEDKGGASPPCCVSYKQTDDQGVVCILGNPKDGCNFDFVCDLEWHDSRARKDTGEIVERTCAPAAKANDAAKNATENEDGANVTIVYPPPADDASEGDAEGTPSDEGDTAVSPPQATNGRLSAFWKDHPAFVLTGYFSPGAAKAWYDKDAPIDTSEAVSGGGIAFTPVGAQSGEFNCYDPATGEWCCNPSVATAKAVPAGIQFDCSEAYCLVEQDSVAVATVKPVTANGWATCNYVVLCTCQ